MSCGAGTRALVMGFGSIGRRHAQILREEGCEVALVTRQGEHDLPRFEELDRALAHHRPDYVVVANRTADHRSALDALATAGFRGAVLVEKPLFHLANPPGGYPFASCHVGYNLRCHPALRRFRRLLAAEPVLSMHVYAGQYLPEWRPGRDYRTSYSASAAAGGGVLRDLSHELDALLWLLGPWTGVAAAGGRLGALDVDCEDTVGALLVFEAGTVVTLHLNYLDREGHRTYRANSGSHTLDLDLLRGELRVTSGEDSAMESYATDRDGTYRRQHRSLLSGATDGLCSLDEGYAVVELAAALERALASGEWVRP